MNPKKSHEIAFEREDNIKKKRHLLAIVEMIELLESKGKPDLARRVEAMAIGLKGNA